MSSTSTTTSELRDPHTEEILTYAAWNLESHPAVATKASATQAAAAGPGVRNVLKNITVTLACGATPQTPMFVFILDGASGSPNVLWSAAIACPANDARQIPITALEVVGSPNTPMTVEFAAAGVANSQQAISATGFLAVQQ